MVLKKSKSPFNSGTTQRCFKGGAYMVINEPSELTLSITLYELPSVYVENNPSTEHAKALDKIYDYLDFAGPCLKAFHESKYRYYDPTTKALSFSLNKQELWEIPERIDKLMKEKNFLDGEEGFAEIRVVKVKRIADRDTVYNKESCVLNPTVKKTPKPTKKQKRQKTKGKKRGVQRLHLLKPVREEDDDDDDDWQKPLKKSVVVELQEEDHVDARILNCRADEVDEIYKRYSKAKSCVNGKNSHLFRRYTPQELKLETEKAIFSLSNSDKIWDEDNNYYHDYYDDDNDEVVGNEEVYDDEEYYHYDHNKRIDYNLPISIDNEVTNTEQIQEDGSSLDYVNTASSQTTFKYPKGSFQVIERPCEGDEETQSSKTSFKGDDGHVDSNEMKELLNAEHSGIGNSMDKSDMNQIISQCMPQIFETNDDFVEVGLQFPESVQEEMIKSIIESSCYNSTIHGYPVTLGNCFPPVFCVNLEIGDSNLNNTWSLVGTSCSDVAKSKDLKWEVTLKNSKSSCTVDNIRNTFLSCLKSTNDDLPFQEVIQTALTLIQESLNYEQMTNNVPAHKLKTKTCNRSQFLVSSHQNALQPELCSTEEATEMVLAQQIKETQNSASSSVNINPKIKIPGGSVECDICLNICDGYGQNNSSIIILSPCSHSFCFECWQSHIFYHLMNGNSNITCMHTDCKVILNETLMKAFIPEIYLNKLHLLQQQKCIDRSPLCQWCPQTKCNKVAVITERNPHVEQFGCCVVCECSISWCFSCQKNPHWPVSCSQAAAYRNLLHKHGDEMLTDVTLNVDLKPCPGCKYPIEKKYGCPHMVCSMCNFNFCWKCLQSIDVHREFFCVADENSTFVTFQLHTDVMNTFPLKFFRDSLEIRKKHETFRKTNVQGWLIGLNYAACKTIKLSFHRSVRLEEADTVRDGAIESATDSVHFLMDCYIFLEYFYILISFALLKKDRENSDSLFPSTRRMIDRLMFTASRLESLVVGKSLKQLILAENTTQMFLTYGRDVLEELKNRVRTFQNMSKDVAAEPIGQLDPKNYYRYK